MLPRPARTPRIKICCIRSIEEAWMAIDQGASAIGLVSAMPSEPGPIDEERIAEIAEAIPPGVTSVLLTCETEAEAIIAQHRRCGTNAVQLVDRVELGAHNALREGLPGIGIIQVVHVIGEDSLLMASAYAPHVDALLLDSGDLDQPTRRLGGTGRTHDWNISARIVEAVDVPVWLAGGLTEDNVVEALAVVKPFGLDVCSGVRVDDRLDEIRVGTFIAKATI
ncbi:phosphoribosylanthranilate isomerase [Candidatus Sumerlaeota bacterium]|nr:phosphoribosylanthranilate isomerase [Candidatus Sumerlaeota bacterium]